MNTLIPLPLSILENKAHRPNEERRQEPGFGRDIDRGGCDVAEAWTMIQHSEVDSDNKLELE